MKGIVQLLPLEASDREQFIADNQEAFHFGAKEEFGLRDDHEEEEGQIISRETIVQSIDGGEAYRIVFDGKKAGGLVIRTAGERGDLELLFVSPSAHSRGIGYAAWCEVEKLHPEVKCWEIVEFFHRLHPDPNDPESSAKELDEQFPDGMFRFEKVIR